MHLYNQILILGDFKEEIIVSHSFVSYKSKQLGSKFKQLGNNGISSCRGKPLLSKPLHGASYKDKWGPEDGISLPAFPQALGSPEFYLVTDSTKERLKNNHRGHLFSSQLCWAIVAIHTQRYPKDRNWWAWSTCSPRLVTELYLSYLTHSVFSPQYQVTKKIYFLSPYIRLAISRIS